MVLVGFPLLALHYTREPLLVSGVVAAGQLPGLLAALPAGVLADRFDRRRVAVFVEAARFVVLGLFALVLVAGGGLRGLWDVYLAAFVMGALGVVYDVVAVAAVPSLVGGPQLVAANTRLIGVELAGEELVGQAVGGALFGVFRALPFLADAASFLASALMVGRAIPSSSGAPTQADRSAWADLVGGLRWFFGVEALRRVALVVATLAFCQAAVLGVLVIYARERLGLSSLGYGLLLAGASLGNLVGALVAPRVHRALGEGRLILAGGVVAALAYLVLATTSSPYVAGMALFFETMAVVAGNVAARTLRHRVTPDEMQGRAGSVFQAVVLGVVPVGGVVGGIAATGFGLRWTFAAVGMVQLVSLAVAKPGPREPRLNGMHTQGGAGEL